MTTYPVPDWLARKKQGKIPLDVSLGLQQLPKGAPLGLSGRVSQKNFGTEDCHLGEIECVLEPTHSSWETTQAT